MSYVKPKKPEVPETKICLELKAGNHGEDISWEVHDSDGNKVAASPDGKTYSSNKTHKVCIGLDCGDYVVTINGRADDGMTKG